MPSLLEILEVRTKWCLIHDEDKFSRFLCDLRNLLRYGLNDKLFGDMEMSFWKELQELFMVPKLHQLSDEYRTIKRNELVIAFIIFLLQLLLYHKSYTRSFEDQFDSIQKELRFLVTVLEDTPLQGSELEEVENLVVEFEAVANDAGNLVYSLFFSTDSLKESRMHEALGALSEFIDLVKGNITKLLCLLPLIINADVTPIMPTVDSLFIVDSLLYDLEDLMNHAKVRRSSEMEEFKEPVMRIKDVAYEAEFLINSYLVGDVPFWYLTIRLPDVVRKIKLIRSGLEEIKTNYDHIGALKVANEFSEQVSLQPNRSSVVDDIIVGFEEKAIDILEQLVGGTEHLQIISIFGMPGLGKTTLAKKLYNHPLVNYHFHKRSWCVVTQTYCRRSLLIEILISLASELDRAMVLKMDEERLEEHIYKTLKGRRYLIVMDDVWDSCVWDDLRRYFPHDGNGCRILFTSRIKDVPPPNTVIHEPPSLSNDQCWELLEKKVFRSEPCPPQLLRIGKEIAANCYGLPLVAVVVSGILSTVNREESTWENVGGSLASYIFDEQNNSTMQILDLSYKHLPHYLKTCFLYFAAFPEGREIPVRELIRLWIAEGFIRKEEMKSLESVAEEYLMELIDKSLIIAAKRRSDGGVKACIIHDLLRDLCLRRAEKESFMTLATDDNYSIYKKHHRICLSPKVSPLCSQSFGLHVRSLVHCDPPSHLSNMKLLRVLTRHSRYVGIELLVHLRYLAITCIPASIGNLVNLEFLLIENNRSETDERKWTVFISSRILKMVKLRYLRITPEVEFDKDCDSSQMVINNLEFLSNVCIFNLKDEQMLKCSPHLRKLKCKCRPVSENHEDGDKRYPDLCFLTQLESLNMIFFPIGGLWKSQKMNFPSNIKKLTLTGLRLPWEKMSIIGELPCLTVLKLKYFAFVGKQWESRDGEFQQLRFLKLTRLSFVQWNVSSSDHFPKLCQLVLHYCETLKEIPSEIGEIPTLEMIEVKSCQISVAKSALQIQEEQRDMGNEHLRVLIL
ncbi:hypothetical protein BUALT_Bualt18G0072900 [Buddleja alternifolia]|uniref:Late blight resistance protein homolog R1A-3 n=1 Tax=Buddleja alternifolia TaxID=168488 RepID=A0AAV6W8W0_9LAMI|nr:hypothetical protein BUALT_Bualt18G0072900 [Buddleja alternifolia]